MTSSKIFLCLTIDGTELASNSRTKVRLAGLQLLRLLMEPQKAENTLKDRHVKGPSPFVSTHENESRSLQNICLRSKRYAPGMIRYPISRMNRVLRTKEHAGASQRMLFVSFWRAMTFGMGREYKTQTSRPWSSRHHPRAFPSSFVAHHCAFALNLNES